MLSLINDCLQFIFPSYVNMFFSNFNIFLCKDFFQLLLISSCILFVVITTRPDTIKGQLFYYALDCIVCLTQVMQQQGEDETAICFRTALQELQESWLSCTSWELLCTCVQNQLSLREVESFQSALWLYYTKEEVYERNYYQFATTNQLVKKLLLTYTGCNVSKALTNKVDNLAANLFINVGIQVMFTTNLWTKQRLVNNSINTIYNIV